MKFITYVLASLALVYGAFAVDLQKQVIISYPNETPDWVVQEAKDAILGAGGAITHEYNLIKYGGLRNPAKRFNTFQRLTSI
jgi:hypothetical protein